MCAYLFLRRNCTCAGLLRTVCLLILEGKSNVTNNTSLFSFNLQQKFCQICHFGCNSIHLRPNLARFRKQIPKCIWEVYYPVHLFGPVRLFSWAPGSNLCAYSGLCVYSGVNSTRYVFTINEIFQMRYCMKFYLKGHQNYNKSKSKVPKKAYFIK